ncbi:MAG TPA: hypothetical protein DG757_01565 [Bacillus sp. (in: Bacteria)]|uniref:ABC-2 family transporter protein n=1 Tax=Anoxybacillus andreesenii TaxID=1325932 RepID=A0ABT9UZ14_9BACL|nr:hypothetical protein [Robertmurraya andreesenii]MDQ0153943.1 hypothetical protein [Robertmurraya andreesenii]HCX47737.1 hypothetical protein [Bacillus sp. (in: firmicutes)]
MNRYLKLVNFETNRFLKLYLVLIGIVFFVQMIGVIIVSRLYVNSANEAIYEDFLTKAQFLDQYGYMSFINFTRTAWFLGPIMLSMAVLIIYVFFIWYRDWLGKNTFAYRLLMLPTERINVYLAKATTMLIFVLGLVSVQLLLFPLENQVMKWLVSDDFRMDFSVKQITTSNELVILFPNTFTELLLYYGGGMVAVCIVFTAILFERSYRLKGIIYGILYCAASLLVFFAPVFVDAFLLGNFLYPLELFFIEIVMGFLVLIGAIWIGHYLLKNKVRV